MPHPALDRFRPLRQFGFALTLGLATLPGLAAAEEAPEEPAAREPVAYVELEPGIVVNFAAEQTQAHFMRAVVSLQVAKGDADTVKKHEIAIRHHLIMFLSSLTEEETATPEAVDAIRVGALEASQEAIARWTRGVEIQDLFFSTLVMH